MKKQKTLYAITTEDVVSISDQEKISITEKDLSFIGDKIEDYFGDEWQGAVKYALNELNKNRQSP